MDKKVLEKLTVVGIDFGTSNTTISYIDSAGFPQLIPDPKYGKSMIPSAIGYTDGNFVFGQDAVNLIADGKQVWTLLKRELGISSKTYTYKDSTNTELKITSEELISKFLSYIKKIIGKTLKGYQFAAVISCPAYFNQDQKTMLQNCFVDAGFQLISIISEPIAACFSYVTDNIITNEDEVIVVDIGGGTTDVAYIKYHDNNYEAFPTSGNKELGGADFTQRLVEKIKDHLYKVAGPEWQVASNKSQDRYLWDVLDKCKKELSKHDEVNIFIPNIIVNKFGQHKNFEYTLTRKEFLKWTEDICQLALYPVTECVNYNSIDKGKIKKVLMVGGGSSTYGIGQKLYEYFPRAEVVLDQNAKFCVSKGNALFGNQQKSFEKSIVYEKINKSVGVVATDPSNINGIEAKKHVVKIIHRGDDIPAFGSYTFRTGLTNQKDVIIPIVQGEGSTMDQCEYVGTVTLDNIGIAKAGVNKITVEFKIDEYGLLTVTASDSINFREVKKVQKLDLNFEKKDFMALQQATLNKNKSKIQEIDNNNLSKHKKFYNEEAAKVKLLPKSQTVKMMISTLKDYKTQIIEATKSHNWEKVEQLQKKYHHLVSDLKWNN